jgi:ABC-type uncharacterized transport system YnjBCD ATPase subunit
MQAEDVGREPYRVDAVDMSRPPPCAVAAFHVAPEKAGAFACKDTGIGEAAAATVVHAEQHAGVDPLRSAIFQDLSLFPHMTVAENVAYGLAQAPVIGGRGEPGRLAECCGE